MAHLLFGFRDLVNTNPNASVFDITSLLLDDTYLKSISPNRYNFYIKFVAGLSNPTALEQFFYKTKEAKDYRTTLKTKIEKLAKLIGRLNTNFDNDDKKKIIDNISSVIKNKFKLDDNQIEKINDVLNTKKGGADSKEDFINKNTIYKGNEPMKTFVNKVYNIAPDIVQKKQAKNITELIQPITATQGKKRSSEIEQLKVVYDKYKDNLSPSQLEITMIDRLIFILVTFIIFQISLKFVDWGLNTNIINNFQQGFLFYCGVYFAFFIFITMIINVIVYYPAMDLFNNNNIVNIPNYFYYFYIYTNGISRLIIHLLIIVLLLFVPYINNIDKITFNWLNNNNKNISADYDKKTQIYNSIYLFSFIIWILTSVIALKF